MAVAALDGRRRRRALDHQRAERLRARPSASAVLVVAAAAANDTATTAPTSCRGQSGHATAGPGRSRSARRRLKLLRLVCNAGRRAANGAVAAAAQKLGRAARRTGRTERIDGGRRIVPVAGRVWRRCGHHHHCCTVVGVVLVLMVLRLLAAAHRRHRVVALVMEQNRGGYGRASIAAAADRRSSSSSSHQMLWMVLLCVIGVGIVGVVDVVVVLLVGYAHNVTAARPLRRLQQVAAVGTTADRSGTDGRTLGMALRRWAGECVERANAFRCVQGHGDDGFGESDADDSLGFLAHVLGHGSLDFGAGFCVGVCVGALC